MCLIWSRDFKYLHDILTKLFAKMQDQRIIGKGLFLCSWAHIFKRIVVLYILYI